MGSLIRTALIVLLATALCACQRSTSRITSEPAASITPVAASAPAASARTVTTAAAAPSPAPTVDTGLLGLLGQGAQDGTLPEDFEIGPLAADRLLADDARAAHAAAAAVLDAWSAARVDRAALAADAREFLAGMIGFSIDQGEVPRAWRLGMPRPSGGETVANFRLLAAGGSAEGEIYTARESGGVRVSDLQVDPARLKVERPQRTFFPSPYRWLLGG